MSKELRMDNGDVHDETIPPGLLSILKRELSDEQLATIQAKMEARE